MKYRVNFNVATPMIFEADGYYTQRDGSLTLFQKTTTELEGIVTLEQVFTPTITAPIATFPRGEWKSVYLQEGAESEQ